MISYMSCLKRNRADAGSCRPESKAYLECRMDNGLMSRDDFQNLGLGDVQARKPSDPPAATPASTTTAKDGNGGGSRGWFGGASTNSGSDGDKRLV